jgi:hypothetical protein
MACVRSNQILQLHRGNDAAHDVAELDRERIWRPWQ